MRFTPERLRLSLLVIVSLVVGFVVTRIEFRTTSPVAPVSWTTIAFQNPSIRVQFPAPPRHLIEQVALPGIAAPTPQGIFLTQDGKGVSYTLAVITYPGEVPPLEQDVFLKSEITRLIPGASLISFDPVTSSYPQGTLSRDFVMRNNAEGTYVQGRIVRDNTTLYTLAVIYPNGYFPKKDYDYFIKSFLYVQ